MSIAIKFCLSTFLVQLMSCSATSDNFTNQTEDEIYDTAMSNGIKFCLSTFILQLMLCSETNQTEIVTSTTERTLQLEDTTKYTRYMVSLRFRTATHYFGDNHYCAGVIIGLRWIVTAAQCVANQKKVIVRPRLIIIVSGTPNRIKKSPTTRIMAVDRVISNPNFTFHTANDIALIHLKGNIILNAHVQIMPLPTKPPPRGARCIVLGWGRLYYGGPYGSIASYQYVTLFTEKQCKKYYPHYKPGDLCASSTTIYGGSPCAGDAGGPLICHKKLVGVISWTFGCREYFYPGVYSDVYYNLRWIKMMISRGARWWACSVVCDPINLLLVDLFIWHVL
ncbi:trypsin-like isoform X1 [Anastrepha ludens]|uniref:trypsin-like isoform X1 n=1 Tax=Anastrepha ludens TaxID=28586 RepID=UPI0023AF440D|nr:trypsin-like isoform X1 [Anastrepha ludens]